MPELTPQQKAQLDNNIKNMLSQGATEDDVMKYASDFKSKYDPAKKKDRVLSSAGSEVYKAGTGEISPSSSLLESTPESAVNKEAVLNYMSSTKPAGEVEQNKALPSKEKIAESIAASTPLLEVDKKGQLKKTVQQEQADATAKQFETVTAKLNNGSASLDEVNSLLKNPNATQFISDFVGAYGDKENTDGTPLTDEQKLQSAWKNASFENRPVAVKQLQDADNETNQIISGLAGSKINIFKAANGGVGLLDSPLGTDEIEVPAIDASNPYQIGELIKKIGRSNKLVGADGKDLSDKRTEILSALQFKLDNIKRTESIAPEIEALDEKIYWAIGDIESEYHDIAAADPTARQSNTDEKKVTAFKRGLNYLKATDICPILNFFRILSNSRKVFRLNVIKRIGLS